MSRRALERAELKRLIDIGRPRDRACLLLMYDLALRAGEVCRQKWSDVEGDHILVRRLKGNPDTWLRIDETTLFAIAGVTGKRSGPLLSWPQQKVRNWFRYLAKKANLPPDKRYSHILRRSRATHMLSDGAKLAEVQWVLGHKSVATTIIYLGITEETQARARKVAGKGMSTLLRRALT